MNFMPEHDTFMAVDFTRHRDYGRIAAAIEYILAHRQEALRLEDIAAQLGLSAFHFQRLFKRWAGVSPKQFIGYLTVEHAKAVLAQSNSALNTAFDVGLSGSSRLHDLFVNIQAMTPGEYKAQGRELVIRHGFHDTHFGRALVLTTDRGVCGMEFVGDGKDASVLKQAKAHWPLSRFVPDQKATAGVVRAMFDRAQKQKLLLRGTNFQLQVRSALLRIPPGTIVSYGDIAEAIAQPAAVRAVGSALAANAVAYLVPCHRVLRSTGPFKSYRWGATRRYAMLGWEAEQLSA